MVTPISFYPTLSLTPEDRDDLSTDPSNASGIVEAALITSHFKEHSPNVARSPAPPLLPDAGGTPSLRSPGILYSTNALMQPHGNPPPISVPPPHTVAWYLMQYNAVVLNEPRVFIPQYIYEAPSQRNAVTAILQGPIVFCAEGSSNWGVSLRDLLSLPPPRLIEGDNQAFTSSGSSIALKVQWPGYQPYDKRILTKDHTAQHRPITIARLAKLVAKAVEAYVGTMGEQQMAMGSDPLWRVGPVDITVDDVVLVSLHQMSKGSWQPQLRLRHIPGTVIHPGAIGF